MVMLRATMAVALRLLGSWLFKVIPPLFDWMSTSPVALPLESMERKLTLPFKPPFVVVKLENKLMAFTPALLVSATKEILPTDLACKPAPT